MNKLLLFLFLTLVPAHLFCESNAELLDAINARDAQKVSLLLKNGAVPGKKYSCWASPMQIIPLHAAVATGSIEIVGLLLEHGAYVNALNSADKTPLFIATVADSIPMIKLLVSWGADPQSGYPLRYAVVSGKKDLVEELLDLGAKSCFVADALAAGHFEIAEILWKHGAAIIWYDVLEVAVDTCKKIWVERILEARSGQPFESSYKEIWRHQNLLRKAIRNKQSDIALLLINHDEGNVKMTESDGATLVHTALDHVLTELVPALLSRGVDINAKREKCESKYDHEDGWRETWKGDGKTALHMACDLGDEDLVAFLIEQGADIALQDRSGATALYYAGSHKTITQRLLSKGADLNLALLAAAKNGKASLVEDFIEQGADCNYDNGRALIEAIKGNHSAVIDALFTAGAQPSGESLLEACCVGDKDLVVCFLSHGAPLNYCEISGKSPHGSALHCAVKYFDTDLVHYLVDQGANLDLKDWSGRTPLHVACDTIYVSFDKRLRSISFESKKERIIEIAQTFIENGAHLDTKNNRDKTPLMLAADNGYTEIVKMIQKAKGLS